MRYSASCRSVGKHLNHNDTGQNKSDTELRRKIERLIKKHLSQRGDQRDADARPDRVDNADGQSFEC